MVRIGLLATLCISIGFAHRIRVDFDHATHFGSYKTYCLALSRDGASVDPPFPSALMEDRVAGFLEEALAARGLKRASPVSDLRITYRLNVIEQPYFITYGNGWGPGWGWGWGDRWGGWGWGSGFSTTTVQTVYKCVLVVDIVDAKRNKLVFQGTSTTMVSSRPERNTKKLAKAVSEVFEKYPPRP